jgi:hypothetical protein
MLAQSPGLENDSRKLQCAKSWGLCRTSGAGLYHIYSTVDNDGAIGLRDYDNKMFIAEYGEEEV